MSQLRQRMDDAMVLRGFAVCARETYLPCVTALARHYRRPPDQLGADQRPAYLLHLVTEKKLAEASVNQAACAFRFLFESGHRLVNEIHSGEEARTGYFIHGHLAQTPQIAGGDSFRPTRTIRQHNWQ